MSSQADAPQTGERESAVRQGAANKTRPSDLWLRGGFEQASVGMAIIDRSGDHLLVNPAYTTLLGRPKSKVVGAPLVSVVAPAHAGLVADWCAAPVQPVTLEVALDRPTGTAVAVVMLLSPLSGGKSTGHSLVQVVAADIAPATRDAVARFNGVIDHVNDLVISTRADGTVTFISPSTERVTGRTAPDIVGGSVVELIHPDDHERLTNSSRSSRSSILQDVVRIAAPHGWVERHVTLTEIRDQMDRLLGLAYVASAEPAPATAPLTAATEVVDSATKPGDDDAVLVHSRAAIDDTASLFMETPDIIWRFDLDGPIAANPAARSLFGLDPEESLDGIGLLDIHPRWAVERLAKHGVPETRSGRAWTADLALLNSDGEEVPVSQALIGHADDTGAVTTWTAVSRPITGNRTDAELRWVATHDRLTGLAGRVLLYDRIDVALARASRTGQRVGLLLLDLDFFDVVNTSVGTDIADRLLKALAERLAASIRPGDSIGRMGDDEFVVVCEHFDHLDDAERFAERLLRVVEEPIELDGSDWFVTMSVGISVARPGVTSTDGLLRSADAAMYRAKELGRGRHVVFGNTLETPSLPFAAPSPRSSTDAISTPNKRSPG